MKSLILSSCLLLVACLVLVGEAHAADDDSEQRADQLFDEAVRLMKADHCGEAIPRFVESQGIDPSVATLINLATCYARLGKTATAWRTYREASEAAVLAGDDELRLQADKAIALLEPTLTRLRVVSSASPDSISISVNGVPVSARTPVPLDPGESVIEATAPHREPWRRTIHAQEQGTILVVEVPELREADPPRSTSQPVPPSVQAVREPHASERARGHLRPLAIGAFGVSATGLVVGTMMAVRANDAYEDSKSDCRAEYCNRVGNDLRETAFDRAAVATWTTGIGVIAAVAGGVLWVASKPKAERRVRLVPWIEDRQRGVGFSVAGRL